jgi:GT2 family glycosyltransferase
MRADADGPSGHFHSKFGADPSWDIEALGRAAAELLSHGDFSAAFALADRRCRVIVPSARDLFLRARAHKGAGRLEAAQRDLVAALALDPTDPALDRAALGWGEGTSRREAAERIAARASSSWALRRRAAAALFENGTAIVHRLRRDGLGVSGWIAWAGGAPLQIDMTDAGEPQSFSVEPDPDHPLATAAIAAAEVVIEAPGEGRRVLRLATAEGASARVEPEVEPLRVPRERPHRPAREPRDEAPFVTVIVPVYEDFAATRACLDSLAAARPACDHRILVVDDASPNAEIAAYLDAAAAGGAFELIRNGANLGFAASVNKALALSPRGDALLLNADALLPPGAVDRLRALSRSSPAIGTLTPFSNNGELTSWPRPNAANPMPSAAEIAALDARAREVNGDALVDIPNGIGFCLYITEACLDAVGALPELYAQGYYEDVEFCLSARERGFRNVAAPGLFVGHAGSRSFAARKRALVMRNAQLIETRFPGLKLETAAFVALDPLKPHRAALDAASPPPGPVTLVACGPRAAAALGRRRAEQAQRETPETTVLTLTVNARRQAAVAAVGGGAPQSLSFDFDKDGASAFAAYLARLDLGRVEWLDPAALPEPALSALIASGASAHFLCGHLAWFAAAEAPAQGPCGAPETAQPCEACRANAAGPPDDDHRLRRAKLGRALERAEAVVPLDRMAAAFAERVFKSPRPALDAPPPGVWPQSGRIGRLGALYPHRAPAIDRLLLRLARRLAAGEAGLVVIGATLDDDALMATGAGFVTGPATPQDYAEIARDYGVEALIGPDRGGGYGDLEGTAAALGLPKAYFDWSFGAFAAQAGDLSLDPRICDDKAANLIVAWMNGERRGLP